MGRRKRGRDVHGILLLDKPLGITSNQALQRVKRLFNANKAGHTGALDPQASGLLPICLGEATKFSQLLLESDKAYLATAKLGEVRSTGDTEGDIVTQSPVPPLDENSLESVLIHFRGDIEQVPPMFSALKLNGKPLYELARQGMSNEEAQAIANKKRRTIRIHELCLESLRAADEVDLFVRCSKGTYIRTLIEDIGGRIGCGAYVSRLHRVSTGPYQGSDMIGLDALEALLDEEGLDALDKRLQPLETAVPHWPKVQVTLDQAKKILQGQSVSIGLEDTPSVQLWAAEFGDEQFLGVGMVEQGRVKPKRLLNIPLEPLFAEIRSG
jgi:tRNA pseudouridine55 synthase